MARNPLGLASEAFPLVLLGVTGVGVWRALTQGSPTLLLGSVAVLYLLPPLLHRLHDRIWPLEAGVYDVVGSHYLPWWGSHQLQRVFITFPVLEATLRLVPAVYSAWLRLWGARVGRQVTWTPAVQILDRSLLDIGDRVVFGHAAGLTSHVITRRKGRLRLLVKPITIGDGALIGSQCGIGPGAVIKPGAVVPVRGEVHIGQVVE